jgi:N-carbamoyl-L-amino-acid hydrolase
MARIDPERLLADLHQLRSFGAEGSGVVRPSLSPIDMDSRSWLRDRMAEAGLEARIDGVGTVYGRSPKPGKALVIGSHSDTQPRGGWLDGALGVIYALEVARALAEDPETRDLPVDIGAWIDEEGTYLGFLGSRTFCGDLDQASLQAAANKAGEPLTAAIRAAGLADEPRAAIEPDRHVAYLEAHIEQGPFLEASGKRIGVVTAIVGLRTARIRFSGVQNHAGTTPMHLRKDAGVALVAFAGRVHEEFRALAGARTVWTIGHIALDPGASSIIPGRAEMVLQFRDPEVALLDRLEAKMLELVAEANDRGPVAVEAAMMGEPVTPMAMDEGLQAHIAAAAERHAPGAWMHMPSGAAHDAQIFAQRVPAAMLFVPSIGGISHDFAEDTAEADILLGCQVLATAAGAILREAATRS